MSPSRALQQAGMALPPAPPPLGRYQRAAAWGELLFLSGMLPVAGERPAFRGQAGGGLDTPEAAAAARLAALNALSAAAAEAGSLDRIKRVVRLAVYIAAAATYEEHARVADAASELFVTVFGPDPGHSRLVFGVASLPAGMPVELEVIFELKPREPG